MTPTDGAGAVPAGGGSSLPLPGGPGIDPAGTTTGARGASLKRDAKAQLTPAHCIARSAAWIELRQMAGARAAVGRRKASAPRSARAASDDAAQDLRLSALRLPLFYLEANTWDWLAQNSDADASRERDRFPLPLRERTDRAQRDQVRAEHAPRPQALTRRAASRRAALSRKGRGQNSASGACGEFSLQ